MGLLLKAIQRLPLGAHYFGGRILALLMRLVGYRKAVVRSNLAAAFPDAGHAELKKTARKFYSNLGRVYAEAMWMGGCQGKKNKFFDKKLFSVSGADRLYQAFDKGSVMILDCHCGNWELTGAFLQGIADAPGSNFDEFDVAVVYRRLHSERWDRIMGRIRCALQRDGFDGYVESKDIMRYALRHRQDRKIYVFPNDQYPYGVSKSREEIVFMNRRTLAMDGAAVLAAKLGMSVFYMNKDRLPDGRYDVRLVKLCDDASKEAPQTLIKTYYSLLEKDIRLNPSNYLWSHKRWK